MKLKTKQIIASVLAAITILCTVIEPLPVYADAEVPTLEVVATAEPETTETPVITEEPVESATPISTETPAAIEEPVESATPISTETPAAIEEPVESAAPVSTEEAVETVIPEPEVTESPEPEATVSPESEETTIPVPEDGADMFPGLMQSDPYAVSPVSDDLMNLSAGTRIQYPSDLGGDYYTHYYTLNNRIAYCMEPDNGKPTDGSYELQTKNDPNAIRALVYGYGGPYQSAMETWLADNGISTDANTMYVYTHIAVSYYYSTSYEKAFTGVSGWETSKAYEWIEYIRNNTTMPLTFSNASGGAYASKSKITAVPLISPLFGNVPMLKTEGIMVQGEIGTDWRSATEWGVGYNGGSAGNYSWEGNKYGESGTWYSQAFMTRDNQEIYYTKPVTDFYPDTYSEDWWTDGKDNGINNIFSYTVYYKGQPATVYEDTDNLYRIKTDTDSDSNNDDVLYDVANGWRTARLDSLIYEGTNEFDVRQNAVGTGYTLQYVYTGATTQDVGSLYSFTIPENGSITSYTMTFRTGAVVKIYKQSEDGTPLAGAKFGIYEDAACTIPVPYLGADGSIMDGVVTTGTDGYAFVGDIAFSRQKIYIKEVEAPPGYMLDETVHEADLWDGEMHGHSNPLVITLTNRPVNGKLTIYKEGNLISGVVGTAGNLSFTYTTGLIKEKAVFDVYANEELTGGDGTKYPAGTLIYGNLETVDGVASIEGIPVGSYKVVEKFSPVNYIVTVTPQCTTMTYNDTSGKYEGEVTFYNGMQEGKVDIIKTDSTTRKPVKDAVIGLYAAENIVNHAGTVIVAKDTLIQQRTTDADGRCTFTGLPAVCKFYVKEISASANYILNSTSENITFVNGKCTVEIENTPQSGSLTIYKEGPVLTGWNGTGFIYETKKLPGFTFRVTAAEDIYHASGALVYAKDAIVKDNLVTGSDGSITVTGLPLGTYNVTETAKKEGYNLNTATHSVRLAYAGQTVEVSVESVTITNSRQPVKVSVLKEDDETGKGLKDAVMGLYTAENITGYSGTVVVAKDRLIDTVTTDADGKGAFDVNLPGTFRYYVKEVTAPKGYILNETKYYVKPLKNGEVQASLSVTVPNEEQTGSLTIYKEGEVLTGWSGSDFVYEERKLSGFTFRLTAGADICRGDGTLIFKRGAVVADSLVTGSDGSVTVDNLYLGTYVVQETGTTDGYVMDTVKYTVKLEYKGQNVEVSTNSVTIKNDRQTTDFSVYKTDADTKKPLAGGEYTIYAAEDICNVAGTKIVSADTPLQTITTGTGGKAYFTVDLPVGYKYYVKETKAPYGYVGTDKKVDIDFKAMENTVSSMTKVAEFSNERVVAKISMQKVDAETGNNVPQGDATLEGAVYQLYALEDIVYPDGANGVIFTANSEIQHITISNGKVQKVLIDDKFVPIILTTDADGKAVAGWTDSDGNFHEEELLLGKYYVKEITAPEGYLLDETKHNIDCSYENDETPVIARTVTSGEQVIKMPFKLTKYGDDGSSLLNPMVGAGFSAYLISDLTIIGYDVENKPIYDYSNALPVPLTVNGDTVIYTGNEGSFTTIAIPYGGYQIVESYVPDGWLPLTPFTIRIVTDGDEPDGSLTYFGKDDVFKAFLRIVKKDEDTGENVLIPGVQFKIFDVINGKYYTETVMGSSGPVSKTVFETDATGALALQKELSVGEYRIEEITAPDGYVLNDQYITITLSTNGVYDLIAIDGDNYALVTVEYPNAPVTGELTVLKQGEILTGYNAGQETAADGSTIEGKFTYTVNGLAGAKFAVYAAEDIYTADMQTDIEGNRTKYYSEGECVGEIVTGADGKGTLADLPLGTYKVVETKAPDGYVLSDEEQTVTFTYVDEKTPVVYESLTFNDDRQKVELKVTKKDAETDETLSGAVFGLYAKEAITNTAGTIIVSAGQLLETAVSDENGVVSFKADIPFAKYDIKELKAPVGYASTDEVVTFDAKYAGQDAITSSYTADVQNNPVIVEFTKEDLSTGQELTGATLQVTDEEGNVIDEWVSEAGNLHKITHLEVGKTYTLTEILAPDGYLKAESIEFTVDDTAEIQKQVMRDEVPTATLIINKKGDFLEKVTWMEKVFGFFGFVFDYVTGNLSPVTFEVYAYEDIVAPTGNTVHYDKDEQVATITTDNVTGIAKLEGLPVGKYYVVEKITVDGYVIDSEPRLADLSYVDQDTAVVTYNEDWINARKTVRIEAVKVDRETKVSLAGAVFGLYCTDDILNDEGELLIKADTLIEKNVTGEDGKLIFDAVLPAAHEYYVVELQAPAGYVTNPEDRGRVASSREDNVTTYTYTFEDDETTVEVSKTDIFTGEELPGAKLVVTDKDGSVVDEWISTDKPHVIKGLTVGDIYTLTEMIPADGYATAESVDFIIENTAENQKIEMQDDTIKVEISKTDITTGEELPGATLIIYDKDGNEVEKWVSTDKPHYIKKLPVGNYILHEESAPDGYLVAEDVYFSVKDTGEVQKVIMKDEKIPDTSEPTPTPEPTSTPTPTPIPTPEPTSTPTPTPIPTLEPTSTPTPTPIPTPEPTSTPTPTPIPTPESTPTPIPKGKLTLTRSGHNSSWNNVRTEDDGTDGSSILAVSEESGLPIIVTGVVMAGCALVVLLIKSRKNKSR